MAAYLGVLLVVTIPGVLVAYVLRLPLGMLLTWAAVPLFSLASVFVLGELTSLTGIPFGVPAFVCLILVLGVAAIVRRVWARESSRNDARDQSGKSTDDGRRDEKVAYGLLALGVLIGSFIWLGALRDVPLVLPGGDGTRHGFLVGRIVHGHSIDISNVMVLDADGVHQVSDYFPLGGHASAALATRLPSADAGEVLVALTVVFAAIVLPLGMFVLARYLAPERPLIAGFTSLAVPALTLFPYATVVGGQVFAILSMAMVPAAIVMMARVVLITHPSRKSPLQMLLVITPAALGLLAVMSVHSSELPLVLFLVLLLALERAWLEHNLRLLAHALVRGIAVGLLAAALFAPTIGAFVAGASERSSLRALGVPRGTGWTELFGPIVTLRTYFPPSGFGAALPALPSERQFLLAALAFVGAAIWLRYRRVAWVVGWVTVIVLSLLASTTDNPLVRGLTFPWYRGSVRLNRNQVFFVPFFAAVVLAIAVPAVARTLRRRSAVVPATFVVAAVFVVFVGIPAYRTSWSFVQSAFSIKLATAGNQARVDSTSEAAFRWLATHSNGNETVINEPTADGSLWMYAQDGVKPLLGWATPPFSFADQSGRRDWENRRDLIREIDEPNLTARVERLIRDYHARWIYFDSRTFPFATHELDLDALRNSAHISEVFHRDTVYVFEINTA